MRFAASSTASSGWRRRPFNSLYEILTEDGSAVSGAVVSFNSLYEILHSPASWSLHLLRRLSILFMRFSMKFTTAWPRTSLLSILFMRFTGDPQNRYAKTQVTFNSLYEILDERQFGYRTVSPTFNSLYEIPTRRTGRSIRLSWLSILFMRFTYFSRGDRKMSVEDFQFSLWDSEDRYLMAMFSVVFFQFSLWDSRRAGSRMI